MVLCKNCKHFITVYIWGVGYGYDTWHCELTDEEILCDADDWCDGYVPLDADDSERTSNEA